MFITMVKEQLLILNLLCAITISTSAKPTGNVNEFNIDNVNVKENVRVHHAQPKHTDADTAKINVIKVVSNKAKELANNKNNNNKEDEADLMYTESDLEEAVSRPLDGPNSNEKNPEKQEKHNDVKTDHQLTDVYTESDLDETVSQDNEKHKIDKRSVNSYAYDPAHAPPGEDLEGSGEGSGDSLLMR